MSQVPQATLELITNRLNSCVRAEWNTLCLLAAKDSKEPLTDQEWDIVATAFEKNVYGLRTKVRNIQTLMLNGIDYEAIVELGPRRSRILADKTETKEKRRGFLVPQSQIEPFETQLERLATVAGLATRESQFDHIISLLQGMSDEEHAHHAQDRQS